MLIRAFNGRLRRIEAEQRERRSLVYQLAFLPNQKRPPTYREFVGARRDPKTPKTVDQLQAIAMQWHAAVNRNPQR